MCYTIPGKVVEIKKNIAIIDYFGEHRNVLNESPTVDIGNYIYAQGGIIIQKIPEKEALRILKLWRKKFIELREIDLKISETKKHEVDKKFQEIIEKAKQSIFLKKIEILRLLRIKDKEELELLLETANKIRQENLKNSCCVHGIIEFSNYCVNNCLYCGIRKENKNLKRYRMSIDEIVETADYAVNKLGFKALVLQSGEDDFYSTEKLVEIIKKIKEKCGVLIFMSVGTKDFEDYKKMYEAGARGVLIRFETSNSELYKKIHFGPKADFKKRIQLIKYANKLGYIVATGSLIGLPGQTEEDLMNDIFLIKKLNAEMYSFGPLIPHQDTPLAKTPLVDINTVLKVLAVSRLIDNRAKILVTTALETLDKKNGREAGLLSGANSLMINVTPRKYKEDYTLYPGRPDRNKEITKNISETLKLLYSLGRAPTDLGL